MKKRIIPFLTLITITLSSCALFSSATPYEKEIAVYDIDVLDDTQQLESCYQTSVTACFKTGQDYIPYLTLKQYASLYEKHFADDVTSTVTSSPFYDVWLISKGTDYCFVCEFSRVSKEILIAGSIDAAFKENDDPRDLKSLEYGVDIQTEGKRLSDEVSYGLFSYENYGISCFNYDSKRYYPLGLLDITISDSSMIYFTYNYKHIFSTRETDNYATKYFIDEGKTYSFDTQMESMKKDASIPSYLLNYNTGLFLYLMDYLYGLREYKGIDSFAYYYRKKGFYNDLFSKDGYVRAQAYSDALSVLDDHHTVLVSANNTWGESYFVRRRYGEGVASRVRLENTLIEYRNSTYQNYLENDRPKPSKPEKDILYSQDGKTAMFAFDKFVFGTSAQIFNDDGTVKDTAKEYDSYFQLIDAFNRIKEKGGVENIVLDISLNGGGVVGVLIKLLALISKNNTSRFCFYEAVSKQAIIYTSKVDINGDEQYDLSDCFGDDFNFYILTSDCSFSCGNAFPYIAQILGDAKIIGQKSGGGECAVAVHYLPNSEYVYHSSNIHIGDYNETTNTFNGFESGATPDIPIAIDQNFYSIENLNSAIKNAR